MNIRVPQNLTGTCWLAKQLLPCIWGLYCVDSVYTVSPKQFKCSKCAKTYSKFEWMFPDRVGRATTNDNTKDNATTNECYNDWCYRNKCYNEQFLSIKSECCSQHRCYKEGGGILFIMESSIIVFTRESLCMLLSSSGGGPFKFHL